METKLERIATIAKTNPKERFTSLVHLISKEMLITCHKEMATGKASGVDKVTKAEYEENLEVNLDDLVSRMKRQAYKPLPARRVYIPKPGTDAKRPLGIPAYEDKLVQAALAKVLNAIYEQDFLECSFGFRPGRSCHDALKLLNRIVNKRRIRYVVDTDIKGFFDNVDQEWLMKFIEHRVQDKNLLRLIKRMLKGGIVEAGIKYETPQGTPQGGCCSPLFGNVYLHYALDLWFEKIVRKHSRGEAYMVRYADDSVFCFEYKEDALNFYEGLKVRLAKFNLEIAEEKTKIIEIYKDSDDDRDTPSFDFLGFTHYLDKNPNKFGKREIRRKTSKKKYRESLLRCKLWMRANRTIPTKQFMRIVNSKIQGHINYYGFYENRNTVKQFVDEVRTLIFRWLNRRSQKRSFSWDGFIKFMRKYPLPQVCNMMNIYSEGAGISYLQ